MIQFGSISTKEIKAFLKDYFKNDPDCGKCPVGCKTPEKCYLDVRLALMDDDGNRHTFSEHYFRDGSPHCCGKPLEESVMHDIWYCHVCGNQY